MGNEADQKLDPRPLMLKRMVWDIYLHDPEVIRAAQQKLGLVPDSEGGMDHEHELSDTRINRTAPLRPVLHTLAGYAAEIMCHYMVSQMEDQAGDTLEVPHGFFDAFAAQNAEVIYESAFAIICHLLDTGVLEYGAKVRSK